MRYRFKITRVSDSDTQPCKESHWNKHRAIHTGIRRGSLWITRANGMVQLTDPIDGWKDTGDTNFYGEPIYEGEFEEWGWSIDIDSIEQLMGLITIYGDILVSNHKLTILDDYL